MSLVDWTVFVFFSVVVALGALGARHLWRGTAFDWGENPPWWPWGAALYRGARRSVVVVLALLATANVVMLLYEVSGSADADALVGPLAPLLVALTPVVLGLMILNVTIIAYNWPKALVPPPLRAEPGLVEESKRRKRRRRAVTLLDRLRRSPEEPVLRPMSALAFVLAGIVLGLLAYGPWWRISLFGLGVMAAAVALVFREQSGTPTGRMQSSTELVKRSIRAVAVGAIAATVIIVLVLVVLPRS